jgi:DNA processing protein
MERDELEAWLRLVETPLVGRESARQLLAALASPEAIFTASAATLRGVVGAELAAALATPPENFDERLARTWHWLRAAEGEARHVVTLGDTRYPQALLQSADPPLLLYVLGRADLLDAPSIAVVGSRNPSAQGLDNARSFAANLSQGGYCIVSGLALGIDGAAHEGGLQGAGSTIAVVGTGLDRVYPKRHLELARRIAAQGAIVSEFGLGMPALAANFPQRNRIIAGLARGTLVVEAALQSGSLITARLAAEAGREVFAIPGSIHSPQSRGCHALLKQGAKLVDSARDILEELAPAAARSVPAEPTAFAKPGNPLLEALGHDPVSLDALVARTGWPPEVLNAKLLELELDGAVARLPGQLFQRRTAV